MSYIYNGVDFSLMLFGLMERENPGFFLLTERGDVSGNGKVTAYDVSLIYQHISGLIELSVEQQNGGDVDGEAGLSINDANLILKKIYVKHSKNSTKISQ